jgi:hypothetical protein
MINFVVCFTDTVLPVTTNVPDVFMARYQGVRNDFEAGNIHYEGHYKGWALKSRLFWALKWQRAIRYISHFDSGVYSEESPLTRSREAPPHSPS